MKKILIFFPIPCYVEHDVEEKSLNTELIKEWKTKRWYIPPPAERKAGKLFIDYKESNIDAKIKEKMWTLGQEFMDLKNKLATEEQVNGDNVDRIIEIREAMRELSMLLRLNLPDITSA